MQATTTMTFECDDGQGDVTLAFDDDVCVLMSGWELALAMLNQRQADGVPEDMADSYRVRIDAATGNVTEWKRLYCKV